MVWYKEIGCVVTGLQLMIWSKSLANSLSLKDFLDAYSNSMSRGFEGITRLLMAILGRVVEQREVGAVSL